ncbi:MAG: amino acid permease [Candidatus Latescibacterota bacterium]|nr:MAG: amino acid permease [Candidatus Latescibacterota bacterium]
MPQAKKSAGPEHDVTFSRDLGLFDASMIGIGAMIGAGIFVLTGIAAGEAGPASILAFALNGLVTLLTALCYAELASAYPRSGGGYSFIKKAFPGPVGFASGWMLWFSYIVACSLYALGFGSYFWEFIRSYLPFLSDITFGAMGEHVPVIAVTILVGIGFVVINMRGTALTGRVENVITVAKIAVLAVFILFGLKVIFNYPSESISSFKPFLPNGFAGVILAMGLTFIAFEGYDLIATVAEEIKSPEKTIPRATMLSLAVTVTIYLLIVFVCIGAIRPETGTSWEFLGRYQETAIVKAAKSFMPFFGVALIIFGGLLSTLSALNATILASSRVAFSMSRDKMLPERLSTIHPQRRTPHIAVAVTGGIMILAAMFFPIHVIGSAASVMFLLTFTLVNLSLIALRRKFPELKGRFRVPLYPVTPIVAIVLNLFLAIYQFNFDHRAWYIAAGWIVVGLFTYFVYFEKTTAAETPQVLEVQQAKGESSYSYRILIPLHNPDHVIPLMKLAIPIAKANQGEIVVLGVIDVPQNLPVHEGMRFVHHKTPLLKEAIQYGHEEGVDTRSALRIAHRVYDGILKAAEEERASLILMGWKGYTTTGDRIMGEVTDKVVRHAPCDLITVKLRGDLPLDRILIPTAGGPHASLAAQYVSMYQKAYEANVSCCYVVREDASTRDREIAMEWIEKTIHLTGLAGSVERRLVEGRKIASALAKAAEGYDMIVLGASKEGVFSSVLFGEIPEKVARYSRTPVMIVKRYEGVVKTVVKKVMG